MIVPVAAVALTVQISAASWRIKPKLDVVPANVCAAVNVCANPSETSVSAEATSGSVKVADVAVFGLWSVVVPAPEALP